MVIPSHVGRCKHCVVQPGESQHIDDRCHAPPVIRHLAIKTDDNQGRKEGNVLFNEALKTFYLQYMASDIW